ncbi:uncharacterized protein ACA1_307140 [Acanthamoeba castellanii str. Neff]|uniref:Uncharacterized protein n=1 Tax=Acanthamoeba castellanii (strain ATCC 30010 / Neff) TaxID=1257118 RepID=L8GV54_ACACF|nr:uncharacterized protein ACA1_307140 [Acanthamoeba castellanii str. Neff]ELR16488.1 hypothetical protein ACA1_307140 [Acanthamoeba castellanii str. Neff]
MHLLCNNITTVVYMNKFGGCNICLNWVMKKIFNFTQTHGITLLARHLPSDLNGQADQLSCLLPQHKWSVHLSIFQALNCCWGPHLVDCMALKSNALLPQFNSRFWEHNMEVVNTLLQPWQGENNWVVLPVVLLLVIARLLC